jgi:isopentenyl-diphosphate delta-isomerase
MISDRKDDHVRIAAEQQRHLGGHNEFDDVSFIHHALAGIDRCDVSLATRFGGIAWSAPLYINAMTGGSVKTGVINRNLATAARETGVAIATGSMSAYFADPSMADTFSVMRQVNPDGFIMANVNATATLDKARRAVDLLRADALQIHLNVIQETVMPEGDRSFAAWAPRIAQIAAGVGVPVIVKEVGFGLSRETLLWLRELGVAVADVAGSGGTNFARIENDRRAGGDYSFLDGWGQSTPACLLDAGDAGIPMLASGGVRTPLDAVRALALGAGAAGVSGLFLKTVLDGGVPALVALINGWLDQLAALMTALGARTPHDLTRCDVLIRGSLRAFCTERGIQTGPLATRSSSRSSSLEPIGGTR